MAVKSGVPVDAQLVPNVTGDLITLATGITRAVITSVNFFASTGATLNVFLVPSGGTAGSSNQQTSRAIALDESFTGPELIGKSIEAGGVLQANDGGAGGTNISAAFTITTFTGDS